MTLLCPRCQSGLHERPAQELVLHGCAGCGGVWLGSEGVARLAEALSSKTLAIADEVAAAAARQEDVARPIDCPICAQILIRTVVSAAGVTIDRCPDHGAFYDRHELQKVARALAPPAPPAPPAPTPQPSSPQQRHSHKKKGPHRPPPPAPKPQPSPARGQPVKKTPPSPASAAPAKPAAAQAKPASSSGDTAEAVLSVAGLIVEIALSFV